MGNFLIKQRGEPAVNSLVAAEHPETSGVAGTINARNNRAGLQLAA
jgi:hypothetical protein